MQCCPVSPEPNRQERKSKMRRSTRIAGVTSIASLLLGLLTIAPASSAATIEPPVISQEDISSTFAFDYTGIAPILPEYDIDLASIQDSNSNLPWWVISPLTIPADGWNPVPTPQRPESQKPKKPEWTCDDVQVKRLYKTGFRGKNLVEAWAVMMRESGGRPDAISATGDYGVFQFNRAAHSNQSWWDTDKLLTWEYNMQVAYDMTDGGRTWYPWDIDGRGDHLARYTSSGTYNKFREWYDKFPCELPNQETDA